MLSALAFGLPLAARRRLARPAGRRDGVNFAGFLSGSLGLGVSARCMARALAEQGVPAAFLDVPAGEGRDTQAPGVPLASDAPFATTVVHLNAPELRLFLAAHTPRALLGRRLVGVWYWELEQLPAHWRALSRLFDEVWFAAGWASDAFASQLHCPALHAPFPLDQLARAPGAAAPVPLGLPASAFVFLNAFDFKSTFARKNPLAALDAYLRAFPTPTERHALVLKSLHGDTHAGLAALRARAAGRRDVHLLDVDLPSEAMAALAERADCFVSLHRSEGLSLGVYEARARGKWALFTDFSGPTGLRREPGMLPVPFERVPVRSEHARYRRGFWAEPDVAFAAERMRELVERDVRRVAPGGSDASARFASFVRERLSADAAPRL